MTQELLRRLTRTGAMYLIPADIHTKRIIRFTVTSQCTTEADILKDWDLIAKTASALLAETPTLNNKDQTKLGRDEVIGAGRKQDPDLDALGQEAALKQERAEVELWIDKAWDRSRRPMRSLSCNSEPLPCTYIGPMSSFNFQTGTILEDDTDALPTQPTAGQGPVLKITQVPSNVLGNQVLKKLTKFYSVPSFGRHPLCCPVKVSQTTQKHLSSTCRRITCMSSSPVSKTGQPQAQMEAANAPTLL